MRLSAKIPNDTIKILSLTGIYSSFSDPGNQGTDGGTLIPLAHPYKFGLLVRFISFVRSVSFVLLFWVGSASLVWFGSVWETKSGGNLE